MGFIKSGIQFLIMLKNFIFLIILNVAAHYDDGLSHEKHKKTAYNGNEDEDKACEQNFIAGVVIKIFYYFSYDQIIVAVRLIVGGCTSFSCIDGMNNRVYYIACKLRRQYPEIIGEDNEEDENED